MGYLCERCKYRFKMNKDSSVKIQCPYCGKSDKLSRLKQNPADDLVRSS